MSNQQTLATKYRPHCWDDVVGQVPTKQILQNQLKTNTFKHAYLFVGSAGTGKTTCARIFAHNICGDVSSVIELDAASNNSVDDIRQLAKQAQAKSLTSAYKVFILDEVHALSSNAWQAMLKLVEEPPETAVFIFCTTNPEKIPDTILSRVQRFNFHRISSDDITRQLKHIADSEGIAITTDALEYIADMANGGLRDSITMLDTCVSYEPTADKMLSVDDVVKALGVADYTIMVNLTNAVVEKDVMKCMDIIEKQYADGKNLSRFIKDYSIFVLDLNKYYRGCDYTLLQLPRSETFREWLRQLKSSGEVLYGLLKTLVQLNADVRWSTNVRADFEASVLLFVCGEDGDSV